MSITTTHVANFKLRLHLLLMGLIIGAALGGWAGHEYVHVEMTDQEAQAFHQFIGGRAKEIIGMKKPSVQASSDRQINFVQALRSTQNGYWAIKFEASARKAYVQFPTGGAIALAVIVMLIGRRIGDVSGRSQA
jgi:hypothetical protein